MKELVIGVTFIFIFLVTNPPTSVASKGVVARAIFSFGDSILDAGTNHFIENCTAQADFPPYGTTFFHRPTGRFTNGRTVPDFISQYIGIEIQKPFLEAQLAVSNGTWKSYPSNGLNFASAGSGVLQATNQDLGVSPIQVQLKQFKALVDQNHIDKTLIKDSVFLLESGSNDVFNYFLPFGAPALAPDAYVATMLAEAGEFVDRIYELGARRVVMLSLGPVGCVPARVLLGGPTNRCFGRMNKMVKAYNKGLESLVIKDIPTKHKGMIGVYGAMYDLVHQFQAIPTRYGFKDVTTACCGVGSLGGEVQCGKEGYKICSNPNEFLFWDYFHPSEHTYYLISKALWAGNSARIRPINIRALSNLTILPSFIS